MSILRWENGDEYDGDIIVFEEGDDMIPKFHGKGKMTYADGTVKEGNWEYGEFKGNEE
jgi:hypothetical protein